MGEFLESFEIIQPLPSGNSEIFNHDLALSFANPELHRLCFVKSAKPSLQVKAANAALENEAQLYKNLQHKNLLHLLDVKHEAGGVWIFLEYVQSVSALRLFQLCKQMQVKLSVPMATYMAQELARTLYYLHSYKGDDGKGSGVIHCNVNLENILITLQGEVLLTDFSCAHHKNSPDHNPQEWMTKRQLRYQSPEFLHNTQADARVDIYSLGVVFWELLTGIELFSGENREQIAKLKLDHSKTPALLRKLNESVDKELEDIIYQCLAYDPVQRFKTARDLELVLSSYLHKGHPEFTPLKLGSFLQFANTKEFAKTQELIRKAMAKKRPVPLKDVQHIYTSAHESPPPSEPSREFLVRKFGVEEYDVESSYQFVYGKHNKLVQKHPTSMGLGTRLHYEKPYLKRVVIVGCLLLVVIFSVGFCVNFERHFKTKSQKLKSSMQE